MKRFVEILALMLSLTAFAFAQAEKAETATPKSQLKIPVWVEESEGNPWNDGKRQGFKVFLEDKETAVKSFLGPRNPTVILVVFDTVADLASVDQARGVLSEALKELEDHYWIGLLRAQDSLSVLQEPTADRALLAEKIQTIQVNGKAGLLDTLEPVSRLAMGMLQKAGVRVCVLYVADSGIAHYRADYLNPVINSSDAGDLSRRFSDRAVQERMSRLSESLAEFTIPIFILQLEYRTDSLNLAYQSGLERIATASNGQTIFCRTRDDIKPSLELLLKRIRSTYVLGVETPNVKRHRVKLRIQAQDDTGKAFERVTHPNQINLKK